MDTTLAKPLESCSPSTLFISASHSFKTLTLKSANCDENVYDFNFKENYNLKYLKELSDEVEYYKENENELTYAEVNKPLYKNYTQLHFKNPNALDIVVGVRLNNGKWRVGDSNLKFGGDDVEIKSFKYLGTQGRHKLCVLMGIAMETSYL